MARPAAHRAQEPDKGNAPVGREKHGQPNNATQSNDDARCATTALKDMNLRRKSMRQPRTRRRGELETPQPRTAPLVCYISAKPTKNREP
jgi:hypothetical protein